MLVLRQLVSDGFSEVVSAHGKTQLAGNGLFPLPRGATQSMGADKLTRRASPWSPAAALQCLAVKLHRDVVSVNIMLTEY